MTFISAVESAHVIVMDYCSYIHEEIFKDYVQIRLIKAGPPQS